MRTIETFSWPNSFQQVIIDNTSSVRTKRALIKPATQNSVAIIRPYATCVDGIVFMQGCAISDVWQGVGLVAYWSFHHQSPDYKHTTIKIAKNPTSLSDFYVCSLFLLKLCRCVWYLSWDLGHVVKSETDRRHLLFCIFNHSFLFVWFITL